MTFEAVAQERDVTRLWPYHTSDNPPEIMRAAANRIYELTQKGERK